MYVLYTTIENKHGKLEITGAAPDKPFNLCKMFGEHISWSWHCPKLDGKAKAPYGSATIL